MTATEIMEMMNEADCKNGVIFENLIRGNLIFRQHNKIMVSISGGSDSDIVLDICEKIKDDKEVEYVWFDTGVEYQATKDHLKYLEERYGIEIKRIKAIKSIPTCVMEYGQHKRDYEKAFNIRHSDCYLKYGMRRTGCVGCPFSQRLENDLQNCATYEPKLYKACTTIFKDSYEYTRQFRRFRQKMKNKDQMTIYDLKI